MIERKKRKGLYLYLKYVFLREMCFDIPIRVPPVTSLQV